VGENVGGIVSWDGGLVFEQVQVEMEAEGYEVQAFILPACAVNAPHRRDRVWFVAHRIASHPHNNGSHIPENRQGMGEGNDGNEKGKNKAGKLARRSGKNAKLAADTPSEGRKERKQSRFGTDCPQDGAGLHDRPERFGGKECYPHLKPQTVSRDAPIRTRTACTRPFRLAEIPNSIPGL